MTYCRKGPESDVHFYRSQDDKSKPQDAMFVCCGCVFIVGEEEEHWDDWLTGYKDAILHLQDHRNTGHKVPEEALTKLVMEAKKRAS